MSKKAKKKTLPPPFDPLLHLEQAERAYTDAFERIDRLLPAVSSSDTLLIREALQRAVSNITIAYHQLGFRIDYSAGCRRSLARLSSTREVLNDSTLSPTDRIGLALQVMNSPLK